MDKVSNKLKYTLVKISGNVLEFDRDLMFKNFLLIYYSKFKKLSNDRIELSDNQLCEGLFENKRAVLFNNEADQNNILKAGIYVKIQTLPVSGGCVLKLDTPILDKKYLGVRFEYSRGGYSKHVPIPKSQTSFFKQMIGKQFIITPSSYLPLYVALSVSLTITAVLLYRMRK